MSRLVKIWIFRESFELSLISKQIWRLIFWLISYPQQIAQPVPRAQGYDHVSMITLKRILEKWSFAKLCKIMRYLENLAELLSSTWTIIVCFWHKSTQLVPFWLYFLIFQFWWTIQRRIFLLLQFDDRNLIKEEIFGNMEEAPNWGLFTIYTILPWVQNSYFLKNRCNILRSNESLSKTFYPIDLKNITRIKVWHFNRHFAEKISQALNRYYKCYGFQKILRNLIFIDF